MQIIVEGHKIDTKDIFSIEDINKSGYEGIVIRMIDKKSIKFKEYTDDLWNFKQKDIRYKYQRLKNSLIEKWEQDKNDLPVFKL